MKTKLDWTIRGRRLGCFAPRHIATDLARVLLMLILTAPVGFPQARQVPHVPPHLPAPGERGSDRLRGPKRAPGRSRDLHQHAPDFMKRLRDLPPAEQERVLANDARFRHLPRERQEMIRENLRRWNALSPEEKERMRERQEIFGSLSPQQREAARAVFLQWRELPAERRSSLMDAFRRLRDLPPGERPKFLSDQEMVKRFSPEERGILAGLSTLLPEPPDESE